MARRTSLTPIFRLLTRHPRSALLVAAAAVLPFAAAAAGLRPDNSLSVWFVAEDPALTAYHEFLHEFGNDEAVAVAYRAVGSALAPAEQALQRQAAERLAELDGVAEVLSAATLLEARGDSDATRRWLRRAGLISDDGRTATLFARMAVRDDSDAVRGEALRQIERTLAETFGSAGYTVHLAGTGVLYDALNQQTIRDSGLYLSLALAVMALLLWATLRRWQAVLIALAAPLAAVPVALGLFVLAGRPMTQVTAILPMLILVIGLADAIHLMTHYYAEWRATPPRSLAERRALVARSAARVAVPCLFTSLTTAIGFLALASSRMPVVRDLGLFAAAGMLIVWALAMVVCSCALALWEVPPPPPRRRGSLLDRALAALARGLPPWRKLILVGSAAVAVLLLAGVTRLAVDTYTLELLPAGHRVRADSEWIERNAGFYTPLEFVLRGAPGEQLLTSERLERLAEWQRRAERHPEVGRTFGAGEMLTPSGNAPGADASAAYLSASGDAARITAYVRMMSTRGFAATAAALEQEGAVLLGEGVSLRAAGYLPLYLRITDYVVASTIWGLLLALLVVFALLGLLFRSLRLTLAAVPANLFPPLLVFGAMGWMGIPLDIATATIGAIILGISVDDSIHFLYRYRAERRRAASAEVAVGAAMRGAGRALVLTSLVLTLGFLVLTVSGSKAIAYFGVVSALAVTGALLADLLLLPALLLGRVGGSYQAAAAPPAGRPRRGRRPQVVQR